MAYYFRLPDLGEGIHEAQIIKWLVKEGDSVKEHDEIIEVETDKALVKVPSPKSGKILSRDVKEGDSVKVGDVLCSIGESGEKPSKAELKVKGKTEVTEEKKRKSTTVIGELEEGTEEISSPKISGVKKETKSVKVLPSVRKLAQSLGVDLSNVAGTGAEGRITEDDVARASGRIKKETTKRTSLSFDSEGRVIRVPLKGIRKTIAENMVRSKQIIPHVTHMDYADVTKLSEFRDKEKERAEDKGVKLTFLPFIVKAVVLALKEFPYVNTSLDDSTNEIVIKQYYNIGIAVDTPHGLMVPVIKNAQSLTILEIARKIFTYAEKSRAREIKPDELKGGTFTITNVGSLGGIFSTPVINYPECAILALGRIQDMAVPEGNKFIIRKMLPLSFTFDHRIIDGAIAAKFVNEVKQHLSNPDNLLMGY